MSSLAFSCEVSVLKTTFFGLYRPACDFQFIGWHWVVFRFKNVFAVVTERDKFQAKRFYKLAKIFTLLEYVFVLIGNSSS